MGASILLALKGVTTKAIAVAFSKGMLEWLLFLIIDVVVKSTKTTKDDEWAKRFKDEYRKSE